MTSGPAAAALFWLAVASLVLWSLSALRIALGVRTIRLLRSLPLAREGSTLPPVSVVIPARDEAAAIEEALASVLAQEYAPLEVVAVNDRSRDDTGAILERMAAAEPRLRVVHEHSLPDGWLGKNHALHEAAHAAAGELLLFVDADVVLERSAVARAVAHLERERLDHLTVAPELHVPGFLARAFVGFFSIGFSQAVAPWRARDPRSRAHVGIGAFNLVRAAAYRAVGGHSRLPMRPDDDMKLGKVLKGAGYRQDILLGRDMVSVEWYPGLPAMIRGLEKNSFATVEYSIAATLAAAAALLTLHLWPWLALLLTGGATRLLNAAVVACMLVAWRANQRASCVGLRYAAAYPVAATLVVYTLLRSAVLTLRQGGIRWRETLYPLAELRANRV